MTEQFPKLMKTNLVSLVLSRKLRVPLHILFWSASYFILFKIFTPGSGAERIDFIYTCIFISPIILAVYLNLYILIPVFLKAERYLQYILIFCGLVALSGEVINKLFDRWIDALLKNYFFISEYTYISLLVFTFSFLSVTTLIKLSKEWAKILREDEERSKNRLMNLQSQLNPHFLLNSLQTIYSQALHNSEDTPSTVLQLSEMLKYTLYESEVKEVPLERELEVMQTFVDMHKKRLDPIRAKINFSVHENPSNFKIIPLIFLPFIENSFKHGIQGSEKECFINIDFRISENKLIFTIENNQGKADKHRTNEFSGIGLENTRKRLRLAYPGKHKLKIIDGKSSFLVILEIYLNR